MWLIFKASFFESRETPLARYFLAKLRKVYGRDHHKNSSIVVWDRYGRCPSFSVQEKREGKKWGTKMRGGEKRIQRNYRHHEEETAHQPTGRGSRKETFSVFSPFSQRLCLAHISSLSARSLPPSTSAYLSERPIDIMEDSRESISMTRLEKGT